jgi:hypothetical protein
MIGSRLAAYELNLPEVVTPTPQPIPPITL